MFAPFHFDIYNVELKEAFLFLRLDVYLRSIVDNISTDVHDLGGTYLHGNRKSKVV